MMLCHLAPCLHYNYNCTKNDEILNLYVKLDVVFLLFPHLKQQPSFTSVILDWLQFCLPLELSSKNTPPSPEW